MRLEESILHSLIRLFLHYWWAIGLSAVVAGVTCYLVPTPNPTNSTISARLWIDHTYASSTTVSALATWQSRIVGQVVVLTSPSYPTVEEAEEALEWELEKVKKLVDQTLPDFETLGRNQEEAYERLKNVPEAKRNSSLEAYNLSFLQEYKDYSKLQENRAKAITLLATTTQEGKQVPQRFLLGAALGIICPMLLLLARDIYIKEGMVGGTDASND